jgi:hypothetical protein
LKEKPTKYPYKARQRGPLADNVVTVQWVNPSQAVGNPFSVRIRNIADEIMDDSKLSWRKCPNSPGESVEGTVDIA